MRVAIIGAGAMGSVYGGLLADTGHDVLLIDPWAEHVAVVNRDGLRLEGACGDKHVRVTAVAAAPDDYRADVAMIWTDTNATAAAGATAGRLLADGGFAVTLQNGIGNVEKLIEALGAARVVAGSSMCSAAMRSPGRAALTHLGMTSLGEVGGGGSARVEALAAALRAAGLTVNVAPDIMALIWTKFALNCSINALCAATGLRMGELARVPSVDRLQDRILDEILAVVAAKGITLADPDLRATVKAHCWSKYSRPSMLQAIEAGKRTEIDALNRQIVEEGARLGILTPFNDALVMLVKGVEHHATVTRGRSEADYARLEAEVGVKPVTG